MIERTVRILNIVEVRRTAEQTTGKQIGEKMAQYIVSLRPFGGASCRLLVNGDDLAGKVFAHGVVALQRLNLASHFISTRHVEDSENTVQTKKTRPAGRW